MEAPPNTLDAILSATLSGVIRPIVREALDEALAEILPEHVRRATSKEFVGVAEAMEILNISRRQLDYLRQRRELPFSKRGRTVVFRADDLRAYLAEGRISARRGRPPGRATGSASASNSAAVTP